mgnify:CR=1 FL=1
MALGESMTGSLFAELTSKPHRETAGSDTAARFDYQKDWAFCKMMRKHIADENYLIAFEYHDDVLFLTPADNPTSAEFCQVKTSSASKPRTFSSLTSFPKGKSSILAKMFSNFDGICSSYDVRVVLVSNNAFQFAADELCAKNLDEKLRKKLLDKLKAEVTDLDEARLDKLHFLVTGVSLESMQSFLAGEAMELFSHKFGEDHGLNIRTWIRLIKSEITRKNSYPSDKVSTTNDLITKKCISDSHVEDTLNVIHSKSRSPFDLSIIVTQLKAAGWSSINLVRLQKKVPEASTDFRNPLNEEVQEIVAIMRVTVRDVIGQLLELENFIPKVVNEVVNNGQIDNFYKQQDYLRALAALVYYDEI